MVQHVRDEPNNPEMKEMISAFNEKLTKRLDDKIFDNPWVAQEYLDSITRRDTPEESEPQPAQTQAPVQFLVLDDEKVEIDLTRFSYADEMARDMMEAHMKLAQIIIEERDMQIATLMAMAMLDD